MAEIRLTLLQSRVFADVVFSAGGCIAAVL